MTRRNSDELNTVKDKAVELHNEDSALSRRRFLQAGALGAGGALAGGALVIGAQDSAKDGYSGASDLPTQDGGHHTQHAHAMGTVGQIHMDGRQPVDPMHFLGAFNELEFPKKNWYLESTLPSGQTLREYLFVASDKDIEIAPGMYFPAWTYNNQVPGPTIRATVGDRIRIWFINEGTHPHTIHFHGWHRFEQDGAFPDQFVQPASEGQKLEHPFGPGKDPKPWLQQVDDMRKNGMDIYEFDAEPVGLHLYHCHSVPLKRHIHKGLYGTFIVDPKGSGAPADRRPKIDPNTNQPLSPDHPVHEMVMVMNGFDTNFDGDNEVYAVNSFAFHYMKQPIPVKTGHLVRIYLVNLTEFDPVNSFHLHAGFFRVYRTGTSLESQEYTDTAMFCQAERAILEFRFREGWPGNYMFHAHQSEFAELGWMGLFDAQD